MVSLKLNFPFTTINTSTLLLCPCFRSDSWGVDGNRVKWIVWFEQDCIKLVKSHRLTSCQPDFWNMLIVQIMQTLLLDCCITYSYFVSENQTAVTSPSYSLLVFLLYYNQQSRQPYIIYTSKTVHTSLVYISRAYIEDYNCTQILRFNSNILCHFRFTLIGCIMYSGWRSFNSWKCWAASW